MHLGRGHKLSCKKALINSNLKKTVGKVDP
jgi:hypothetical protein